MLTPQEVNDKGFGKVMLNGYDAGEVDDFLETVSNDYNALYKENAILKGKLKVLVEKVEEYRSTEDAMRMALLTAQRMGEEITAEATRNKDEMLQKCEQEIKEKISDTSKRVADEEMRLAVASKETAKFIEVSQAIMRKHTEFLEKLEAARLNVKPVKSNAQESAAQQKQQRTQRAAPPARATPPAAQPIEQMQQPTYPPVQQVMPPAQQPMHQVQPQQPVHTVPPVQPMPPVQPIQPIYQDQQTKAIPPVSARDIEIDDIALQIGSVVEKIADDEVAPFHISNEVRPPDFDEPPSSLFEDDGGPVRMYMPESELEETSPRPKFDFDDLKFGANFDSDD